MFLQKQTLVTNTRTKIMFTEILTLERHENSPIFTQFSPEI